MIIIKLQGGLGNQLFLYGLYKNLIRCGRDVKMDIESGFEGDELRTPCLSYLGLEYVIATEEEVTEIRDSYMDPISRIRRKLFGRKTFDYYEPEDGNFDPEVLEMKKAYLNGYFQSERYFGDADAVKELKDDIFKNRDRILASSDKIEDYRKEIENCESVSLHIRRGDYLTPGIMETYGGICTDEYYEKAIDTVRDKHPGARLFVFSNDLEWCKGRYGSYENVTFVGFDIESEDEEADFYRDDAELFLMAACKHQIITRSSFGWWGAWLNENPNKITCSPEIRINTTHHF